MPRKEFVAFTRLDASDVNTYLMDQSVMTFASSGARGSAIPTPTEGMVTWLDDINDYQYYNGSAWIQLVAPTGLTLLTTTSFSGAGVVDVTSVFTSTYQNYQVQLNIDAPSVSLAPYLQLLSGATPAATNYSRAGIRTYSNAATIESERANLATTLSIGLTDTTSATTITIFNPQLARATLFAWSHAGQFSTSHLADTGNGRHSTSTAYDGLRIGASTGNMTGTVRIYGLRNS